MEILIRIESKIEINHYKNQRFIAHNVQVNMKHEQTSISVWNNVLFS